jgi:hypothetical protein
MSIVVLGIDLSKNNLQPGGFERVGSGRFETSDGSNEVGRLCLAS